MVMNTGTGAYDAAKQYWTDKLSGEVLDSSPLVDIQGVTSHEFGSHQFTVTDKCKGALDQFSKNNSLSLFVLLLTSYKILLHKVTGQQEITVSTGTIPPKKTNLNRHLLLRDKIQREDTFKETLMQIRETVLNGVQNQEFPIGKIAQQFNPSSSRSPYKNYFVYEAIHSSEDIETIRSSFQPEIIWTATSQATSLVITINFNKSKYSPTTIKRLAQQYQMILDQVVENVEIRLKDIEIMRDEEKKQIMVEFNQTQTDYPSQKTITDLFNELLQNSPQIPAIVHGNTQLSYEELDEIADNIAGRLRDQGIAPQTRIGIMAEKSVGLVAGILGILKAGCVYVPIDHSYPQERIEYIIEDSGMKAVLLGKNLVERFSELNADVETMSLDLDKKNSSTNTYEAIKLKPEDMAYIMYTSGTTGQPKGVMVTHRNIIRLVKNNGFITPVAADRLLMTGSIAFDITTFEMWFPLLNRIPLHLINDREIIDIECLKNKINAEKITILHLIPQLFEQCAVNYPEIFAPLNVLLVGGDLVRPIYINEILKRYPHLNIIHMYGPTENTTFSTAHHVKEHYPSNIPIGKPIANSYAYILDDQNHLLPIGVPGELCVSGDGVSLGYWKNEALTGEKFVDSPFLPNTKLYKTGDLARWTNEGTIEFLGRTDRQTKIRGKRVELGEIENKLLENEAIKEAIAVVREDMGDEKRLCAYFTSNQTVPAAMIRDFLASRLPEYMIPQFTIQLGQIPLTPHGKVDRRALPVPDQEIRIVYQSPRNELEEKLVNLWAQTLELPPKTIGIDHDFFDLGGHSLNAVQLLPILRKNHHVNLSVVDIFEQSTIRKLAEFMMHGS